MNLFGLELMSTNENGAVDVKHDRCVFSPLEHDRHVEHAGGPV